MRVSALQFRFAPAGIANALGGIVGLRPHGFRRIGLVDGFGRGRFRLFLAVSNILQKRGLRRQMLDDSCESKQQNCAQNGLGRLSKGISKPLVQRQESVEQAASCNQKAENLQYACHPQCPLLCAPASLLIRRLPTTGRGWIGQSNNRVSAAVPPWAAWLPVGRRYGGLFQTCRDHAAAAFSLLGEYRP